MLTLKELRFKGIGRFVEEQTINFETLGNLIQVDGLNKNTGGSSGAAKSTIFNALDFLFGINTIPNSILQSRLTDEPMTVEGRFDLDGKSLTIARGKKLKIDLDGEVTTGSSKLTEEKLDEIIAIPRHLFRPMLHKVQGERGFFLSFTPKETNDFLTDCLGLGRFRKYIEELDKRLIDLSKMTGSVSLNLEASKSGLSALENAKGALGYRPKPTVDRDVIIRLKQKSDFSLNELKDLLAFQKIEKEALETTRPSIIHLEFDTSAIKRIEEERASLRRQMDILEQAERNRVSEAQRRLYESKTKLSELRSKIKLGITAKEEAVKVAIDVKRIRESFCPTCEQEWKNDSAKQKERELLSKIAELKITIGQGLESEAAEKEEEKKVSELHLEAKPRPYGEDLIAKRKEQDVLLAEEKGKESQHYSLENAANKAKQDAFAKEQRELAVKHETVLGQIRGQADLDKRQLERAVVELKMYEDARVRYETAEKTLQDQESDLTSRIKIFSGELESLSKQSAILEELKKAIKSYLSCCFDEALEYIGENATKLVRNVPNMANATIQLKGVKENKDGKVKEEVNAVLHLDGDENIDIRSLCGGERSAIDLAVDLSVIELIQNKTNKGINVFVLDEPFTGLDTICIEMALEILKNFDYNKKLIIVDHNPMIKEFIRDSVITVIREGNESKVL